MHSTSAVTSTPAVEKGSRTNHRFWLDSLAILLAVFSVHSAVNGQTTVEVVAALERTVSEWRLSKSGIVLSSDGALLRHYSPGRHVRIRKRLQPEASHGSAQSAGPERRSPNRSARYTAPPAFGRPAPA